MPPKKKPQSSTSSSSSSKQLCCVCCQPIAVGKDESLFSGGDCQQSLHRYCAGVSLNGYKEMKGNGYPFCCFSCSEKRNKRDIATLKCTVELLKQEISELKSSLTQVQSASTNEPKVCGTYSQPSYASATASGESTSATTAVYQKPEVVTTKERYHLDKKFNVVIYGIKECQKGTSKHERFQSDLISVVSVLTGLDNSIQSHSVKDIYRLGKFSQHLRCPRPLLVKLIRVADVSSVLSKRGLLSHPVFIKPDLTPEEGERDSVLLKERWSLIQSGVDRRDIRIRDSRLYVKNKLYGHVNKSEFQYSPDYPTFIHPSQATTHVNDTLSDGADKLQSIVPSSAVAMSQSPKSPVAGSPVALTTSSTSPPVQCNVTNSFEQSLCQPHQSVPVSDTAISD